MKRLRLDSAEYQNLHRRVLERDGWRCQVCGSRSELQVHHIQSRAQFGSDSAENLVALCHPCHRSLHLGINAR